MNNKGVIGIGVLISLAVAVIVCLVLLNPIASYSSTVDDTVSVTNQTISTPAPGSITELTGQELFGTPLVTNYTGGQTVQAGNYTIYECVRTSNGLKGICYKTATGSTYNSTSVNITYVYGVDGYMDDASGRSIVGLIVLLCALGIGLVFVFPVIKEWM